MDRHQRRLCMAAIAYLMTDLHRVDLVELLSCLHRVIAGEDVSNDFDLSKEWSKFVGSQMDVFKSILADMSRDVERLS